MRCASSLLVTLVLSSATLVGAAEKPILVLDAGGHTATVRNVQFTPDGKEVVTVSDDKTIRCWDVRTGEPLRTLRPPIFAGSGGKLFAAAISPDGNRLAVGGYGPVEDSYGTIYLISLTTGRIERRLLGHTSAINDLAFSADGRRLLSGSGDYTARVWDVAGGECLHVLKGHAENIFGVAFAPDGLHVATASYDDTARVWSLSTLASTVLRGHTDNVYCVDWSPDGKTIATGSDDLSIRLWNADGTHRKTFADLGNKISSLTFTPDSQSLLFTRAVTPNPPGWDSAILDLKTGRERLRFDRHTNTGKHGSLSRDGELAVTTGGNDHETFIWKTADGTVLHRLISQGRAVWGAAWSGEGTTIAWGNNASGAEPNYARALERSFHLTDLSFGPELAGPNEKNLKDLAARRAQPTRGSTTLAVTDHYTLEVRRGNQAVAAIKLEPYSQGMVTCFTLLPGDRIVVGTVYGVYLYDGRTGAKLREFQGHTGFVSAVAPSPDDRWILSAADDQTLRVWDPDREEPLLSLFFAGNEWIAWTPEGYYAASPGGERLMGWHVNRGKDELAEFHPAARFRKELYRPDVIPLLLRTGSLERALNEADRARGRKSEPTDVEHILPPRVRITSPQPGKVAGAKVSVTATAESRGNHPVTTLRLLLDGQQLAGKEGVRHIDNPRVGAVQASWSVTLAPGKHRLQVLADSAVSQGASDEVTVTYEGEEPVIRKPRLVVLAIGISKYTNPNVGKLDYAAGDAKAVVGALQTYSKTLFREMKTKLLLDEQATRDNILDGLDWLIKETSQDDYALVFFAGHGETDNSGNVYFLPVDADKESLRRTAVAGEELMKAFRDLPPSKRVLILDACHAGGVSTGKRRSGVSVTDNVVRELLTPENGVVVMCSSTGREFSQESHKHKMGIFTLALTEGLSGKGTRDSAGLVFTHHLHSYVCDRVKELTKGEQHPVMKNPDEIRSFPLARPE